MLRSLVNRLRCPACGPVQAPLRLYEFGPALPGEPHVDNGVLVCVDCHHLYPVEDSLADLVPPALQNADALAGFVARFMPDIARHGLEDYVNASAAPADTASVADQLKQRRHFDWYADNQTQSYEQYQSTPSWRAADEQTVRRWRPRVRAGSWILDVGCADGRGGFYFADVPGITLIGFDVSRKMAARAIRRARLKGFYDRASFLVADAASLPFASETFDIAITFGVLHHLPDPGRTSRALQAVLRDGGLHLALENNLTAMRPLFDLMMKLLPLWSEEAGREPLISRAMIVTWLSALPVRVTSATSVFVPPHMLNWLGRRGADAVLRVSDAMCRQLPLVRDLGGLIVFAVEKTIAEAADGASRWDA